MISPSLRGRDHSLDAIQESFHSLIQHAPPRPRATDEKTSKAGEKGSKVSGQPNQQNRRSNRVIFVSPAASSPSKEGATHVRSRQ